VRLKLIAIAILLSLLLPMAKGEINGVVVTEHYITVVQEEYGKLTVSESMVFNNSGYEVVGRAVAWIPIDGVIEYSTGRYERDGNYVYWMVELPPGESIRMDLNYVVSSPAQGIVHKKVLFEKELQYHTNTLILTAVTKKGVEATTTDMRVMSPSTYDEGENVNIAHFVDTDMHPQKISIVMEWASREIIPYVGVAVVAAVLIALPLLKGGYIKKEDVKELETGREALLSVLSQLEDDYKAGKISEEEYQEIKSEYEEKVIKIMKKLDKMKGR